MIANRVVRDLTVRMTPSADNSVERRLSIM